ncbi:MAG: DUF512 domain-containing protein [Evtepia sp.]
MSNTIIKSISPGSPAERAGIRVGELLRMINNQSIRDVLDYKYYSYDANLSVILTDQTGVERSVSVHKADGELLGLEFETYLMDRAHSCANHCIFCFVDQLPPNMRASLYFKDDDARLSFLMGNYVTLTNMSEREIQRIMDLHISPINISVHATEPELRSLLLGNKNGAKGLEIMRRFAKAKIKMNCQIVACPGINDGVHLDQSMEDLAALYPAVNSVSIVPIGVTKWRAGLYPLRPYTQEEASVLIHQTEAFARTCFARHETSIFWCSDEFYLRAGLPIPEDAYYEEYTQLENGVGMLRLLAMEFHSAAKLAEDGQKEIRPFSLATGVSAAPFLRKIIDSAASSCHTNDNCTIYPIINHFFGETINVAGLITGSDLIGQLKDKPLGARLLIAQNMLRHGENVFLDDITLDEVSETLGVPVIPVGQDGFELFEAIFEGDCAV